MNIHIIFIFIIIIFKHMIIANIYENGINIVNENGINIIE